MNIWLSHILIIILVISHICTDYPGHCYRSLNVIATPAAPGVSAPAQGPGRAHRGGAAKCQGLRDEGAEGGAALRLVRLLQLPTVGTHQFPWGCGPRGFRGDEQLSQGRKNTTKGCHDVKICAGWCLQYRYLRSNDYCSRNNGLCECMWNAVDWDCEVQQWISKLFFLEMPMIWHGNQGTWKKQCTNGWVNDWMMEWMDGLTDWLNESLNQTMNHWVSKSTNE